MRTWFLRVFVILAAVILVVAIPVRSMATPVVYQAVIASGIISLINLVLAVVGFELAIGKSHQVFMSVVFGGMGIRMALVLIAFTILLLSGYHPLALALSLMGFYLIVLTAEVMYALQVLAGRKVKLEEASEAIDEDGTLRTTSLQYASN